MIFGEETKFTAIGKEVATLRSVQIKVAKYSITDEICKDLSSHANTCVLGKECRKIYNWNIFVNVSV